MGQVKVQREEKFLTQKQKWKRILKDELKDHFLMMNKVTPLRLRYLEKKDYGTFEKETTAEIL